MPNTATKEKNFMADDSLLAENSCPGFTTNSHTLHQENRGENPPLKEGFSGLSITFSTGREQDNTGLLYFRARYYSPSLQRFISEDPIGLASRDVNFYLYTRNSPLNYTDPTGNFGVLGAVYGSISGAVGGYISSGGTFSGLVVGGLAGGIVGFVNPLESAYVGTFVGNVAASLVGQAAGMVQKCGNLSGITNSENYSVAAAFGAGIGGIGGRLAGAGIGSVFYGTETITAIGEGIGSGIGEYGYNLAWPATNSSPKCGCN